MDAIRKVSMAELEALVKAGDRDAKMEMKRRKSFDRFWPKKRLSQRQMIEKAFEALREDPEIAAVLKHRDGDPMENITEEAQDDWGHKWCWLFASVEYDAATALVDGWTPNGTPDEVFKHIAPNFELKTKKDERAVMKVITACHKYWQALEWGKPLRESK